jgi:hypothetical protein
MEITTTLLKRLGINCTPMRTPSSAVCWIPSRSSYTKSSSEEPLRRLLNLDSRFEVHVPLKRHDVHLR